jgi:hypothetical protein
MFLPMNSIPLYITLERLFKAVTTHADSGDGANSRCAESVQLFPKKTGSLGVSTSESIHPHFCTTNIEVVHLKRTRKSTGRNRASRLVFHRNLTRMSRS